MGQEGLAIPFFRSDLELKIPLLKTKEISKYKKLLFKSEN